MDWPLLFYDSNNKPGHCKQRLGGLLSPLQQTMLLGAGYGDVIGFHGESANGPQVQGPAKQGWTIKPMAASHTAT